MLNLTRMTHFGIAFTYIYTSVRGHDILKCHRELMVEYSREGGGNSKKKQKNNAVLCVSNYSVCTI